MVLTSLEYNSLSGMYIVSINECEQVLAANGGVCCLCIDSVNGAFQQFQVCTSSFQHKSPFFFSSVILVPYCSLIYRAGICLAGHQKAHMNILKK